MIASVEVAERRPAATLWIWRSSPVLPTEKAPFNVDEFAANLIVVSAPAASLNVAVEDVASNAFAPA